MNKELSKNKIIDIIIQPLRSHPADIEIADAIVKALKDANCIVVKKESPQELRGEGEWISVKDRLPKQATFVVVFKYNGKVLGMYYNADKQFMYGEINQTSQIIHWKPLPAPPN